MFLLGLIQAEHFHQKRGQKLSWGAHRAHATAGTARSTESTPATPFHSAAAFPSTFPSTFPATLASTFPAAPPTLGSGQSGLLGFEGVQFLTGNHAILVGVGPIKGPAKGFGNFIPDDVSVFVFFQRSQTGRSCLASLICIGGPARSATLVATTLVTAFLAPLGRLGNDKRGRKERQSHP